MYIASSRDSGTGPKRNWAKRVGNVRQLREELRNLIMFELNGEIEILHLTRNEVAFRSTILKCWDIVEYVGEENEMKPFHNLARCISELRIHTQSTKMIPLNSFGIPLHIHQMFAGGGNMEQLLRAALPAVILTEYQTMNKAERDYYYAQLFEADMAFLADLAVATFYSERAVVSEAVEVPSIATTHVPNYVGFKAVA